jgi:RES domain-containing protein
VILYRCFPWDGSVQAEARGGALWFPRMLQGEGRHDAPGQYGCLYVSEEPVSAVVEQVARFVGTELAAPDLVRGGLPLALAALELPDGAPLVDLDEPLVLTAEKLRPSLVATNDRSRTQADAGLLHARHEEAVGLRWWSTFESQWANVTLFDRALETPVRVEEIRRIGLGDEVVGEAARFLGLAVAA